MDIEFGAYVIALRVRRVDNTKMVENMMEFLFVKVAIISRIEITKVLSGIKTRTKSSCHCFAAK